MQSVRLVEKPYPGMVRAASPAMRANSGESLGTLPSSAPTGSGTSASGRVCRQPGKGKEEGYDGWPSASMCGHLRATASPWVPGQAFAAASYQHIQKAWPIHSPSVTASMHALHKHGISKGRAPPRVSASGPSELTLRSRSFQIASSSADGAVPIRPVENILILFKA